jgi:hypothetical protein
MRESTLNREGALASSVQIQAPALRALLLEEACAVVARKYPELYYEPELKDPVIPDRELTDAEEAVRQLLWEQAAAEYEAALDTWRVTRDRFLDLEVARLWRRYLRESRRLERLVRRIDLPAGVRPWLERQRMLGAFARVEARVFLYLMLVSVEDRANNAVDEAYDSWGAESFQAYVDHVTAVYDGGVSDDALVSAVQYYRRRDLVA